jgi:hypothetical protein
MMLALNLMRQRRGLTNDFNLHRLAFRQCSRRLENWWGRFHGSHFLLVPCRKETAEEAAVVAHRFVGGGCRRGRLVRNWFTCFRIDLDRFTGTVSLVDYRHSLKSALATGSYERVMTYSVAIQKVWVPSVDVASFHRD